MATNNNAQPGAARSTQPGKSMLGELIGKGEFMIAIGCGGLIVAMLLCGGLIYLGIGWLNL